MYQKFTLKNYGAIFSNLFTAIVLLGAFGINKAEAGAWPVRPGKVLVSLTGSYFNANQIWDKYGKKSDYPDGGYYRSYGLSLYAEIGVSRNLTLVTSIPYISNTFTNNTYKSTGSGLGDAEIGGRIYITNIKFKFYLAAQGTIIVPMYTNNTNGRNLGYQAFGTDAKIIGSGSGKMGGTKSFYYTVEAGARQYSSGEGPVQLRGTASFGLNLDPKNQISLSGAGVYSSSDDKTFTGNIAQVKDFSYVQASINGGHSFTRDFSVFVGYSQFFVGSNTGVGSNFTVSLVNKF
jgi:hypothetical protein